MTALLEATDNWAFNIDCGYVNAGVFLDRKKDLTLSITLSYYLNYIIWSHRKCLRIAVFLLRQSYAKMCCQWCHFSYLHVNLWDPPRGQYSGLCCFSCILMTYLIVYQTLNPECMQMIDTHLTYADNDICSIEASLNQDLSNINRWLIANKLTLNMTKTECMLIGSGQKLNSLSAIPALEINGTQLNRVNFTKSLGVLIDENLTWSNHINLTL